MTKNFYIKIVMALILTSFTLHAIQKMYSRPTHAGMLIQKMNHPINMP